MATACGLTVIKRFFRHGVQNEEYSNTYWFTGGPPADDTAWRTFFDAVVTSEKAIYLSSCQVIRGYGYNDDSGHKPGDTGDVAPAVFSVDLTVAPNTVVNGSLALGTGIIAPSDAAVWARWKTSRRTNPGGKPIYVRKYFHPAIATDSNNSDQVLAAQKTALTTHATKMQDGTLPGARKITTCGVNDVILAVGASSWITTRTLKRRGKRPNS